ncbi:MAG: branched-chain amino acid ABC transporter permease [Bacillota bacterium]|nr:branched-chain amino acid ABC transporter permease [Patescibacteria group bacterium]MDW7730590.1 branched-chain amino acid ABC transporter permease [Bacillota bacterium]
MTNDQNFITKINSLNDSKTFKMLGISPFAVVTFMILAIAPIFMNNQYILHLYASSLMFGALAMGFDFTAGFINIVNFGYAAFVGIGAYTAALLVVNLGISPWPAIIAGALLSSVLGFFTGILTLRLRGMFAALMAWFLGITLMSLASNLVDLTRGQLGLNVPPLFATTDKTPFVYMILVITAFGYVCFRKITSSNIGLAFRAIGQDLEAAHSSGIDSTKYKVLNFTVSCFFAGLVGGFYGFFVGIITPAMMHTRVTVEILVIAYIGGRGSLWGSLLAALLIIPIFEYLKPMMEIRLVIYGLLLIMVMIFYPGGLAQLYQNMLDLFKLKQK